MAGLDTTAAPSLHEDRSRFAAAEATIATIVRWAPDLADADAAWSAFADWLGPGSHELIQALRRAGHSLFTSQLHQLYAFGRERIGRPHAADLCRASGHAFAEHIFAETLRPLIHVARAEPGRQQAALVEMIQEYLTRYAGITYTLATEVASGRIICTLRYRDVEGTRARDIERGLDPDQCFRDGVHFIAGAMQAFSGRALDGFDGDGFACEVGATEADVTLPVPVDGSFAYASLLRTLLDHVNALTARQRAHDEDDQREQDLILGSPIMRRTWNRVRKAAHSDELVLLRGPSGTGKSFIARKIHGLSKRRDGPFVEVALTSDVGSDNMVQSDLFGHEKGAFTGATAQKAGLFALADAGTIFLDEIGDASAEVQAKLLRVIEGGSFRRLGGLDDQRVNVRIVAATNRDLEAMAADGTFRQDLYYRINVITIPLPPLVERRDDVAPLAEHLLARAATASGAPPRRLAPGLSEALGRYEWPGNVRELDHALRYAAAMAEGEMIDIGDLPDTVRAAIGDGPAAAPAPAPSEPRAPAVAGCIDGASLRSAIRREHPSIDDPGVAPHENPAHIEHAKRVWLSALIDELGGDLQQIGRFWDRGSEKTLRKLIREYGLSAQLAVARSRLAGSE